MKTSNQGFGLFGLLITFAIIVLMLWYSLDLFKPVSNNPEAPQTIKEQTSVIQSATEVKNVLETNSQLTSEMLEE